MAIEIIELPVATLAEANPYFDFESIDTANPDWIWMLFGSYGKEIASKIPLETTRFPYYTQWPKIDPEQRFAIAWPIWGQERYPIHMQGIDEYLAQEGFEHEKRSLPYHLFIPKSKKTKRCFLVVSTADMVALCAFLPQANSLYADPSTETTHLTTPCYRISGWEEKTL